MRQRDEFSATGSRASLELSSMNDNDRTRCHGTNANLAAAAQIAAIDGDVSDNRHHVAVAAETADHIAVMYARTIVEIGSAQQVLLTAKHPYTRALLESRLNGSREDSLSR